MLTGGSYMEKLYGEGAGIILPEKLEIPLIDDKRLTELYHLLKPIVTVDEMKYLLKEFTLEDVKRRSYIWNIERDKRDVIDASKLETVDDFLCLHTWGYYGLFKPSIAEVLSQAPENVIENANLFEIIESPQTSDDVFKYEKVLNSGYHLSKVRAYKMHK
jgi:hypothetical protein